MKTELEGFNFIERLSDGKRKTYSLHKDKPLIGIGDTTCCLGQGAVDFVKCKKDDLAVLVEKDETWYFAVLPFNSKIRGYKLSAIKSSPNLLFLNCKAIERVAIKGYYRLLKPIYVGSLDFYQLEPFEL